MNTQKMEELASTGIVAMSTLDPNDYDSNDEYFEAVEDYEDAPEYVFEGEKAEAFIEQVNNEIGFEILQPEYHADDLEKIAVINIVDKMGNPVVQICPEKDEIRMQVDSCLDLDEDIREIETVVGDIANVVNNDLSSVIENVKKYYHSDEM